MSHDLSADHVTLLDKMAGSGSVFAKRLRSASRVSEPGDADVEVDTKRWFQPFSTTQYSLESSPWWEGR